MNFPSSREFTAAQASFFRGARVVLAISPDDAGALWAARVARRLDGIAAGVRAYTSRPPYENISEHLAAGLSPDELVAVDLTPFTARVIEKDAEIPVVRLIADSVTGEIVEPHSCENCQTLEDQLNGAQREIRGWRARYAELSRQREKDARSNGLWMTAQRLFEIWKKATGHKRSPFTPSRFYECEPYLKQEKYGPEMIERAIAGIVFDPFITTRKNGTQKRHDGWELLFRSPDRFEEYVNRAPRDFQPTLTKKRDETPRRETEEPLSLLPPDDEIKKAV